MTRWRIVLAAGLALFAVETARLGAQISPGDLSRPHVALEGSRYCLSCHRPERGVDGQLCLDCHKGLADRVRAGKGLHAGAEYQACERCHSEHNGREFELVRWPEGETAFDHRLAGWPLEGRHARLACAECHRADRVAADVAAREPRRDLARTKLGLATGCTSCHRDPHEGSMRQSACTSCHSQESWKAPAGFDHQTTRFALTGAHLKTECARCHRPALGETTVKRFDQFAAAGGSPACAECHRDVHAGRLGSACESCHSTTAFKPARRATSDFAHDRTAYPLRGRHLRVECARCHTPGHELRIAGFERCATCHRDPHRGQFLDSGAATAGACDRCHSVDGFSPARFGVEEHDRTRFALVGGHLAVPCNACHEPLADAVPSGPRGVVARQYRFSDARCAACHQDPHRGDLDRFAGDRGCRACHDETAWRGARFDHALARFQLTGAHTRVACERCHAPTTDGTRRFAGRPLDCAGCHRDVHGAQFAVAGVTDCGRCHGVEAFRPLPAFDHATTRFPLDGRHARVPCAGCHRPEPAADGTTVVRYKPLPIDCAGCHGASRTAGTSRSTTGARAS